MKTRLVGMMLLLAVGIGVGLRPGLSWVCPGMTVVEIGPRTHEEIPGWRIHYTVVHAYSTQRAEFCGMPYPVEIGRESTADGEVETPRDPNPKPGLRIGELTEDMKPTPQGEINDPPVLPPQPTPMP